MGERPRSSWWQRKLKKKQRCRRPRDLNSFAERSAFGGKSKQIIGILKESEAGRENREICRKHGITEQTFYRWRSKYGGMSVSEARRLKDLEVDN